MSQQLTHTHPRSGSLSMPWDHITDTFAVSMAATPVAQRRMGFKATRPQKMKGSVAQPGLPRMHQEGE